MRIILGSKSSRRRELLEMMGYSYIVDAGNVSEDIIEKDPIEYVKKTALKKGLATSLLHKDELVLCADTIVVCNNVVLEKPKDKSDAYSMIELLQDNEHFVYTAVYLGKGDKHEVFYEKTTVHIGKMTKEEIEAYINTNEPYDKAGAYAIQGIFAKYIKGIEGDYYNVMGLPIHAIYTKLKQFNK